MLKHALLPTGQVIHYDITLQHYYRAPELFEIPSLPYMVTEVTDIWSLGCCLFCAAFG